MEMRGERLHELQEKGGVAPAPSGPCLDPYTEGGADATGTVRPLALVLRRSAAATKAPSTGFCAAGVWTCPPVPSLVRLGSGEPTCWAKRGLPL